MATPNPEQLADSHTNSLREPMSTEGMLMIVPILHVESLRLTGPIATSIDSESHLHCFTSCSNFEVALTFAME